MKMKNQIKSIAALIILLVSFTSCKKEEVKPDYTCTTIVNSTIYQQLQWKETYVTILTQNEFERLYYTIDIFSKDSTYLKEKIKVGSKLCDSDIGSTKMVVPGRGYDPIEVRTIYGVPCIRFGIEKIK